MLTPKLIDGGYYSYYFERGTYVGKLTSWFKRRPTNLSDSGQGGTNESLPRAYMAQARQLLSK
ncbi:hypothetical protein [Nostoc sp. TCL240-02]|uniref:hypothetical protein n=1 Tax=Nostoc sp. TCL240-02 TaxID=2572090 RepID=UPI0020C65385|nr:hypothetical protein [Nostoc sp. TCL240-02]